MKVSLLSENLQKKILFANHAVSNRGQLPILSNFLIKAKKGNLIIKSTDLEIGISIEIPAKVEEEGITAVSAKIFSELVSMIPTGKINLNLNKHGLELTTEKIKTVFQVSTPDEFPKLYENIGEETMTIKKEDVTKIFNKVIFATSQENTRPILSGVLFKKQKNKLLVVATDGYRLSLKESVLGNKEDLKGEVLLIVPTRVIRELIVMSKNEGDIKGYIAKENNQMVFLQNGTVLVGRAIEGEFPNYEKIIPDSFSTKTSFDREELQKAIKACYVFARETTNVVRFSIKKEKMIVSSSAPSVGETSVDVEARMTGEENEIAFNGRYLLDLLSNIEEDTMSFEMSGSVSPGVFKVEKDPTFLHLIMPIRVQQGG